MGKKAAAAANTAVLYARVSTGDKVREGISLDVQEERLNGYVIAAGLTVETLIVEEGLSGAKPLAERPGGRAVQDLVKRGKVRHVVALKLDRLFRDAADCLARTQEWNDAGVALHLLDMGGVTINTASAMGRMFFPMSAGFAELERNLITERTATALAYKKRHGDLYGPVAFGYQRTDDGGLVPDASEQETVRAVKAWRASGMTLRAIADRLNADGVPTKTRTRAGVATVAMWYASTVKDILDNDLHADGELTSKCIQGCIATLTPEKGTGRGERFPEA